MRGVPLGGKYASPLAGKESFLSPFCPLLDGGCGGGRGPPSVVVPTLLFRLSLVVPLEGFGDDSSGPPKPLLLSHASEVASQAEGEEGGGGNVEAASKRGSIVDEWKAKDFFPYGAKKDEYARRVVYFSEFRNLYWRVMTYSNWYATSCLGTTGFW